MVDQHFGWSLSMTKKWLAKRVFLSWAQVLWDWAFWKLGANLQTSGESMSPRFHGVNDSVVGWRQPLHLEFPMFFWGTRSTRKMAWFPVTFRKMVGVQHASGVWLRDPGNPAVAVWGLEIGDSTTWCLVFFPKKNGAPTSTSGSWSLFQLQFLEEHLLSQPQIGMVISCDFYKNKRHTHTHSAMVKPGSFSLRRWWLCTYRDNHGTG